MFDGNKHYLSRLNKARRKRNQRFDPRYAILLLGAFLLVGIVIVGAQALKKPVSGKAAASPAEARSNGTGAASFKGQPKTLSPEEEAARKEAQEKQAAIVRDIATMTSSASSGNNALKLSFSADYTFSKLLTMSFYYDRQTNTPLLSSSSYPTTTQDFGLSIKFSLTR